MNAGQTHSKFMSNEPTHEASGAVVGCDCDICRYHRASWAALNHTAEQDAPQGDCEAARATWGLRKNIGSPQPLPLQVTLCALIS